MNNLSIDHVYFITIAVYAFFFIYYCLIPKDKLPTFYNIAATFRDKFEEYDWDETIRRESVYNLTSVLYLILFFCLSKIFGKGIAVFGLLSFCVVVILFGIWIGPVKKN